MHRYANPLTIHWGPACVRERLEDELRAVGATRVLLVTTRSAAANPRLASAVEAVIGGRLAGRFERIGQHAPAASIMEAVEAARAARADALVSLGGGSPIDAAKAVAFSLATGLDLRLPDAPARARRCNRLDLAAVRHARDTKGPDDPSFRALAVDRSS